MTTTTTRGRGLAIAAALAFTAGGLLILLGPAMLSPAAWTAYHVLTVLTVAGTIAAGHLAADAARARARLAALGFAALFATGTALVVAQSVGRQAETSGERVSHVEAANALIAARRAALETARADVHELAWLIKYEMAGRPKTGGKPDLQGRATTTPGCGTMCKGYGARQVEAEAKVAALEREIAALGTPRAAEPKARRLGEIAALAGLDAGAVEAIVRLIEPLLWTLFFEVGSIVSLGFAARSAAADSRPSGADARRSDDRSGGHTANVGAADSRQTSFPATFAEIDPRWFSGDQPQPPQGPRGPNGGKHFRQTLPANVIDFRRCDAHPVIAALERNGGSVASNRELARLMSVTDGEATKRVREVLDLLVTERVGKELRIALRSDRRSVATA